MDAANSKPEPVEDADEHPSSPMVERYRAIRDDPGREARWAKWQAENSKAVTAWNDYVDVHGLPLAGHRLF